MADKRRRPLVNAAKRQVFLARLAECGRVKLAAQLAGLSDSNLYQERKHNPEFAEAWRDALDVAMGRAEDEAYRRAVEGVERAVYHKGTEIGYVRQYSDNLLMFLLKAHRPEKYRDNCIPGGADGGAVDLDAWTKDTEVLSG